MMPDKCFLSLSQVAMVMLMIILLVGCCGMQNFMKLGVEQVKYEGLSSDDL
jgi:hypothetical protein